MQTKPYPEAKRRILIALSPADIIKFLEEVTDTEGKLFIRNQLLQRKVSGFRDGHAPFTQTVPQLITKLKREQELTNPDSAIWNSFANAWMHWVNSHQELDNTLTAFDNGADFDENHNCITPPNSELDIKCFEFVLETSRNTSIHQELVKRFYEFGYFNEDERIETLIDHIPSQIEVERNRRILTLPDQVDKLSQDIERLSESIKALKSRVSAVESTQSTINALEQKLLQRITKERQHFDTRLRELNQTVLKKDKLWNLRLSEIVSRIEEHSTPFDDLVDRMSSLESSSPRLQESINSFEKKLAEIQSLNRQEITQLVNQQVKDEIKPLDSRILGEIGDIAAKLKATEIAVSEIKSQMTDGPRISAQALEIGNRFKTELEEKTERYSDENDYLDVFRFCLRKFDITDFEDEEMGTAIHIALKTFPAIEIIDDARIIRVWKLMCDNHFKETPIRVEMGWLGLQDWFPDLFARKCFGEKLEPVELEASIGKMLELGNMPWMIYFLDCDRSFPDAYLPGFLEWMSDSCPPGIRALLIRCSGTNRCETNEDFYERVARLPKPKNRQAIEARNLKPSRIPLTLSEWESWCRPNPDIDSEYKIHYDFLEDLRSAVESRGIQIPMVIFREIQRYLQLSHNLMEKTLALDWALTLRLLPWIGNRRRLIDAVLNLVNDRHQELPRFQEELQRAREEDE